MSISVAGSRGWAARDGRKVEVEGAPSRANSCFFSIVAVSFECIHPLECVFSPQSDHQHLAAARNVKTYLPRYVITYVASSSPDRARCVEIIHRERCQRRQSRDIFCGVGGIGKRSYRVNERQPPAIKADRLHQSKQVHVERSTQVS